MDTALTALYVLIAAALWAYIAVALFSNWSDPKADSPWRKLGLAVIGAIFGMLCVLATLPSEVDQLAPSPTAMLDWPADAAIPSPPQVVVVMVPQCSGDPLPTPLPEVDQLVYRAIDGGAP